MNLAAGAAGIPLDRPSAAAGGGDSRGGAGLGGTGISPPCPPLPPAPPPGLIRVIEEPPAPAPPPGGDPVPREIPSAANILLKGLARLPASAALTSASNETGWEPPESPEASASRAAAAYREKVA